MCQSQNCPDNKTGGSHGEVTLPVQANLMVRPYPFFLLGSFQG